MEKIEVGYKKLGNIGDKSYYHKYLLYTNNNGEQFTISGFPENNFDPSQDGSIFLFNFGNITTKVDIPYNENNSEYENEEREVEIIIEEENLSVIWDNLKKTAIDIDKIFYYNPFIQNSNSTVDFILETNNLKKPEEDTFFNQEDFWAPASDNTLDVYFYNNKEYFKNIYNRFNTELYIIVKPIKDFGVELKLYDPLVLDLNHDGIINTSELTINSTAFYDLDNDGFKEQTGWLNKEDGFLINGTNNTLFGVNGTSGYSELKSFDSNNDNLIDNNDLKFNDLKVWRDYNQNGIIDENETTSLEELKITNINLVNTVAHEDSNGNTILATSTFTQDNKLSNK